MPANRLLQKPKVAREWREWGRKTNWRADRRVGPSFSRRRGDRVQPRIQSKSPRMKDSHKEQKALPIENPMVGSARRSGPKIQACSAVPTVKDTTPRMSQINANKSRPRERRRPRRPCPSRNVGRPAHQVGSMWASRATLHETARARMKKEIVPVISPRSGATVPPRPKAYCRWYEAFLLPRHQGRLE